MVRRDIESEILLIWLQELDESNDVSSWEAGFIKSVLHGNYHGPLSEKQKSVIYDMQDKYDC